MSKTFYVSEKDPIGVICESQGMFRNGKLSRAREVVRYLGGHIGLVFGGVRPAEGVVAYSDADQANLRVL